MAVYPALLRSIVLHSNVFSAGLQRRISITIVHESDIPDLRFKDVKELVVGRLRTTPQANDDDINTSTNNENGGGQPPLEPPVLSLSLLPASYTAENTNDERSFFHFQASWDSSLHNSALLNRVTPNGKQIYMTISAYLELENCVRPVCVTKDICMAVFSRDSRITSPRNFKNLFVCSGPGGKGGNAHRATGIYELSLKRMADGSGSPGVQRRQRRVLDTSSAYVRGEENLQGKREGE